MLKIADSSQDPGQKNEMDYLIERMKNFLRPEWLFFLAAVTLLSGQRTDNSWMVFDNSQVAAVYIDIDPDALEWIYEHPYSDSMHIAQFHFTNALIDESVEDIGFRLRGNTSRDALKKSFKVSFNTFVPGREFYGLDKLDLNGEHNDPSIIRSKLCWDFFNSVGVTSSRSAHTAVYLNDQFYGLYISVEHIDDEFLSRNYSDDSGNLWKCLWPADLTYLGDAPEDYYPWIDESRPYELKTNEEIFDYSQLAHLISIINNTTDPEFADSLESVLFTGEFLKYIAVNVLTGSWDDYWFLKNNYYLYHEPAEDKFHWIPYDYDNTFGIDWFNFEWSQSDPYTFAISEGERPLVTRIMDNPELRNLFTHFLEFYLGIYSADSWEAQVLAIRDMLIPWVSQDTFRQLDYGFDGDGGLQDYLNSYDADHYSNQHVKRSIFEFREMRIASLQQMLNYTPAPPMIYHYNQEPQFPMVGDSLQLAASVFDNDGLTFVQLQFTPDNQSTDLYTMTFDPVADTKIVEESDRYRVTIPPYPGVSSAEIQIIAMDSGGHMSFFPPNETITIPYGPQGELTVRLNEFMAVNDSTIVDEEGNYEDWIELTNLSDEPLLLDGMYLSDDPDNLTKWQFPFNNIEILPQEFLLIWTDDDEEDGPLHTNFKLSRDGEFISLMAADGVNLLDAYTFGPQQGDISMGRIPDGTGTWDFMATPSPGFDNDISCWNPGDLNCDQTVDVLDIVVLVDWVLNGYLPSIAEMNAADLNEDSGMDVLDIVMLVGIILAS